ncbi:glycosyltransferase family 4 protein [Ulvibacter litoralis]|uniref:glycosyltransferase family 4 protein n=1 Tax=Ulvibacter litoralis TaxID=227084 RepID=UPI0011130C04|nr:glycosyltransferase family 4 protein [Ulvibacter litoralis]
MIESLDVNDSSGTKGRVALLQSFVKSGYEVIALHYTQRDVKITDIECIKVTERRDTILFILSRIQRLLYRWFKIDVGSWVDSKFGFSFGFFNDANSLKRAVTKYNPTDFDMIWTLSKGNSYRSHKTLLLSPKWHSKWYAYVHDPYPQQLYPRPYNYVPYGFRKKRNFFREITLKAKYIVFPSQLLKDWMLSYYVEIARKSLIIPHQLSGQNVSGNTLPDYFDSNKFNVLHAGNLLDLRDPKPVVEAFELFLKQSPSAKKNAALFFLGKKSIFSNYLKIKAEKIPQIYASQDYVPFEQVFSMQQNTSVNIILEATSEISPFLPGKFAHCVEADVPILLIGPHYSECKRLFGSEYPYSFEFDDINKIANAFHKMYDQWMENKESLKLNRPDLQQYLSAKYLKEVLEESTQNQSS